MKIDYSKVLAHILACISLLGPYVYILCNEGFSVPMRIVCGVAVVLWLIGIFTKKKCKRCGHIIH